ncbi:MAG: UbiX family flavin prenyltransferase [Planctomycetaceae bacterium]|nr:UbiX family flavin prenyltransferase [Planctomycetaceae bacterium]
MSDIVLAITGASGVAYGLRLLDVLLAADRTVHVTMSPSAGEVLRLEQGIDVDLRAISVSDLMPNRPQHANDANIRYHHYQDFKAGIASGSFRTAGMVVCPCSMGTLASIANGLSSNLIHRAADVHLKERRKLVLVPRETPLSSIQLGNMKTLSDAGAVILPAMPGFYHQPKSIEDMIDFVVSRICDQLEVDVDLTRRWGTA